MTKDLWLVCFLTAEFQCITRFATISKPVSPNTPGTSRESTCRLHCRLAFACFFIEGISAFWHTRQQWEKDSP